MDLSEAELCVSGEKLKCDRVCVLPLCGLLQMLDLKLVLLLFALAWEAPFFWAPVSIINCHQPFPAILFP